LLDPDRHFSDLSETSEVDELKRWLREYCATRVDFALADERKCFPPHVILDFGNKGLLGMTVPVEDGGLGLSNKAFCDVLEQLGAIDTTLCLFVGLSNVLGIRPLQQYASPEIRELYLEKLATGRILGAFALTEPAAGSNPLAMQTTARWCDGSYVIDGTKHWIGNATSCGVVYIFARTFDGNGKFLGISSFAVDRGSPGLFIGPEAKTMGMRATAQARVILTGVRVSPDRVLGGIGCGLDVAQDTMMRGRLVIAAAAVGTMKRCALIARRYAERRGVSTGRLFDHPVTRAGIADLNNRISAVASLVSTLVSTLDKGLMPPLAIIAACKIAATEFVAKSADDLIQILGGRGYIDTNYAPQIYRDTRILRIFEGPSETLAAFIGSVAYKSPDTLRAFLVKAYGQADAFDEALRVLHETKCKVEVRRIDLSAVDRRLLLREFAGRLVTLAVLSCANDNDAGVRHWLHHHYVSTIAGIDSRIECAAASVADLNEAINHYRDEIGEFESLAAGEDHQVDPFLRNEWSSI
jgi:alkylation response protein AidB-like acyl-CoA dehydrogenase